MTELQVMSITAQLTVQHGSSIDFSQVSVAHSLQTLFKHT